MRMIISRWLTPLNPSRTMRGVRRRDDNSRMKVQNVCVNSSAATGQLENARWGNIVEYRRFRVLEAGG